MENKIQANQPGKKKLNDFVKLGLGITALIGALVLLKYGMGLLHVI